MEKLILIDGNSILHRAFHALPPFKTSKGEITNAVYGFSSMLLGIMNNEKPDYIAVAFDMRGPTFRHKEYKEYKATRTKAPDELYSQIPRIKEVVMTFQIPIFEIEGFEADDLLGTLAKQAEEEENLETYILTGDRDALQLVSEKTKVIAPIKGINTTKVFDPQAVLEKYGVTPEQVPDLKGLQGDNSDNIKGVAGVGPKTAKTLLQKYKTVEGIYEHIDELKGKVKENLVNDKESAFLSKKLATIVLDAPKKLDLNECKTHTYDREKIEGLFAELEFSSLIKKLQKFDTHYSKKKLEDNPNQASLF